MVKEFIMFPKEIVEILQKYQDNSILLNDINNNVSEIIEDSITLRSYIESIRLLKIQEIRLNDLLQSECLLNQQTLNTFL